MKAILYIVVFKFFLVGLVFGQGEKKVYLSYLRISECNEDTFGYSQLILNKKFVSNRFNLKFGIVANCCAFDTMLCSYSNDTIRFIPEKKTYLNWKNNKTQQGGFKKFCNCQCFFLVDAQLLNLNNEPKIIFFDDFSLADSAGIRIYDETRGFIDFGWYKKNYWKTFTDNSNEVNYQELKNCFGKEIESKEIKSLFNKLGNDSAIFKNNLFTSVDYILDKFSFQFDKFSVLERIDLTPLFKNSHNIVVSIGKNRKEIEGKIGKPNKEQLFNCVTFEDNGTETERPCNYECYYSNQNLNVLYDLEGNVESIEMKTQK